MVEKEPFIAVEEKLVSRRIALIGECMIEMQGQPQREISQTFGGDTFNTAAYLARLTRGSDIDVQYVSGVGTDAFSAAMLARWHEEGVGSALTQRLEDKLPGLYFIQTDPDGERHFLYWRSDAAARYMFDAPSAEDVLATLTSVETIYLSGISLAVLTEAGRRRLIDTLIRARDNHVRVAFDNNFRARLWPSVDEARRHYRELLQYVDVALLTFDDDQQLFGFEDSDALFSAYERFGIGEIVVKRGAEPCLVRRQGERVQEVAGERIDAARIIDTTAAGDSFSAAYLACRLQGGSPEQAARWGHRLASTVIQHRGAIMPLEAMPPMPD